MRVVLRRERLWDHILRRNMSINAFARKAGLRSGHLSEILRGRRNPTGPVREKLLKATRSAGSQPLCFDDLFEIVEDNLHDPVCSAT